MMLMAWSRPAFQRKMTTAHVGSLHRFDLFEKYGNYNTGYKIAGDYELLLRPGKELNSIFVGEVTAAILAGGNSDCFAALKETPQGKNWHRWAESRLGLLGALGRAFETCSSACRNCLGKVCVVGDTEDSHDRRGCN
jgi:hypothetical protein